MSDTEAPTNTSDGVMPYPKDFKTFMKNKRKKKKKKSEDCSDEKAPKSD